MDNFLLEDNSSCTITSQSKITDFIEVYENMIPHSLCDRIIKEYESADSWQESTIGTHLLNKEKRNVNEIGISCGDIIDKNPEIRKKLDEEIFQCAGKAIQKYNKKFPYAVIEQDSGYQLLRYNTGQFYKQHTDSYKQHPRAVSCSFALNDDFEGGEFAFFNQELKYNLKKGSVIMFPSTYMYPHEVLTVTKGTRYSIVTWFI
jgi:Rps23 Pro-64 3,4-dihydroxylase Tpa1-like proline 4-hydroxylase